ncbi:response regulator [Pseudonocardia humida]|uniref:Response regulator transcription factor n=1 Tax=Pseudonocardia humida TaxID=2800819 RepID=A0ABT0ZV24_9PSEU|nr:response regulator transcription factor [Pseudonocardia humida]MCO1654579.1 response regulator transcription factor [Pseudonocardia humida]
MTGTGGARPDPAAVLLVDDHRVFADALAIGVAAQPDLTCAAVAYTAAAARAALAGAAIDAAIDVALVDLDLPDDSGMRLVEEFAARRPVIVLTAHPRLDLARRAAAAGAAGFLAKDAPLPEILAAVRAALAGSAVRSWETDTDVHLTARELEVLSGLGRGRDATRIAADLGISVHTTRDHIRALLAKLGVHSQLDAVVTADRLRLIAVGTAI